MARSLQQQYDDLDARVAAREAELTLKYGINGREWETDPIQALYARMDQLEKKLGITGREGRRYGPRPGTALPPGRVCG